MTLLHRFRSRAAAVVTALAACVVLASANSTAAIDVGQPAPDFKLPSTNGTEIALSDYRSKKWVFLEFYGGDFHPT
jgi:hypothetical protein